MRKSIKKRKNVREMINKLTVPVKCWNAHPKHIKLKRITKGVSFNQTFSTLSRNKRLGKIDPLSEL
ncbi:MAG: hypothetical protein H6Q25_348 [Bacteroidetes bacterium]|nr:hypothetical protein [Bacteroidota bacterium]